VGWPESPPKTFPEDWEIKSQGNPRKSKKWWVPNS
jgi:hypothetical protein